MTKEIWKKQVIHLYVCAVYKAVCEYLVVVRVGGTSDSEVGNGGVGG